MYGFYSRILEINAEDMTWEVRTIDDALLSGTFGGKGLASYLLLHENPPGIDALSPDNRIIFCNGAASGSNIWGSCRYGVFTKSPQTGFYTESYSGGKVSERMASTGYDAFIIRGAFRTPIWIEISDKDVVFHNADHLWGKETYETEDLVNQWIQKHREDCKVSGTVCIGPAGENGVVFALIENDYWRCAGRTGVGAVLGSKNIKALSFWGSSRKVFADPALLLACNRDTAAEGKNSPGVIFYKQRGTPMIVDIMNKVGGFPTRYWNKGRFEGAEKINSDALHTKCAVKPKACLKCFLSCGRLSAVKEGRHRGLLLEGPEYETIYAFGGLCEIDSIEEILYLNDICDRLGVDTISAGNLAAFTIEAVRMGRVDYPIDYGDVDGIAQLLNDITYRRGIGDLLAQGIRRTAESWDMEDQAVHVKGLEPAGYDPRVLKGMGLAYGTSDRGACHLRSTFYKVELTGMMDPDAVEGKAEMFTDWEDRLTIFDTLIFCRFYRDLYQWEHLSTMIKALTGIEAGKKDLRKIAGDITNMTRRFNIREGLVPEDDHLPSKFYRETLQGEGKSISRAQMDKMLSDYYKLRGWNEDGVPQD